MPVLTELSTQLSVLRLLWLMTFSGRIIATNKQERFRKFNITLVEVKVKPSCHK